MGKIDYSIIGKRFGHLIVMKLDHIKNRTSYWLCKCDCGNEKIVNRNNLNSRDVISCGCYREEHKSEFGKKHGLSQHPLYIVWSGIIQRCTNKNADNYQRYGGRGIFVCDEWKNDFKCFYDWAILAGYQNRFSIERINNNDGYYPNNCRWATNIEQGNNKRSNHFYTYNGVTHTIAEWSRILGVNHETLRYRILHNNFNDFMSLSMAKELICNGK